MDSYTLCCLLVISLPGSDSFRSRLMFCWHLFFFSHEISELRRPIAVKFCTTIGSQFGFIIPVQNLRGAFRKNILWAKNMQNLAQFRSTSEFDGEYLQNEWRCSKLVEYMIYRNFFHVRRKSLVNFGPLIAKISMWNRTHPNWLFWKTIFRPLRGAAPPNFYMH